MRLLTVSHFYEGHGGGIERVAAQLCRQFAKNGHHTVWAASDSDPPPNGVEALPLRCANPTEAMTGLPMPIPGPRALRDLSRAIHASDAVIVHDALYLTSVASMLLAKIRGKPVVLIQHIAGITFANATMRGLMRLANRLVTRPMLRAADQVIFISEKVRRELLGEPASRRSMLLYNGVDSTVFHPENVSNRDAVRKNHGIPVDAPIAIFVGRFVEKKGMTVLEALARQRPGLHLVLVGTGPIRPESWGLANVHVLGPRTQHAIAELYGASDLLLLPSVGEGYPLVIQEAMACGLPVVCGEDSACADPGAARWLRGVDIDLTDPDLSALRCGKAIDSSFDSPVDRDGMAGYAAQTYSWARMAGAIIESLLRPVDADHCATSRAQPR